MTEGPPTLHLDFESRSAVDLKKTGVYRYAEDPTTDVWCAAFAIDDGEVFLWTPDQPPPIAIREAAIDGWPIIAHNANFERVVWREILHKRYGWPLPKLEQWSCTMVMALAMALPGSLDQCAGALGVDLSKDMVGHALMMRMARPRKLDPLTWWDDEERKQKLFAYCKRDVEVERLIHQRLMPLRPQEQTLWHLDQAINGRGVQVDVELCEAAKKIVAAATEKADARLFEITGKEVSKCSNAGQLAAWCRAQGVVDMDSVAKDRLEIVLARDDLEPHVREALTLRQATAKTSVSKIDALLLGMSQDGRARGLLQFHAATTGRWGGRRFQPQNLKRPKTKNVDSLIRVIRHGSLDLLEMLYDDAPLSLVGDCIRGTINARPAHRLLAADFSNIEGRVLAWLAGENWKLQAFHDFDAGKGPDLYKVAYAKTFGVSLEDIDDAMRQIGKVEELALGFQGGPGALNAMAIAYGIDFAQSYDLIVGAAAPGMLERAEAGWNSRGKRSGMAERAWIPAEITKMGWRSGHPATRDLWQDLERGAMESIAQQYGKMGAHPVVLVEPVKFRKAGSFLWCRLPSGRSLCYPFPRYAMKAMPWVDEDDEVVVKKVFAYKGVDSFTRRWETQYAYGGLWAENITQAVARDVMAEAMVRLERAGYPVILTVHDEIVCEVPIGFGSLAEFRSIMTETPEWAYGLPIAAGGWEGERYRK